MLQAGDRVQVLRRPRLLVGGAGEPGEAGRHEVGAVERPRRRRTDPGSSQRTTPASGWLRRTGQAQVPAPPGQRRPSPISNSGVRSPSPSRPSTGTTASGRYCTCWVFTYPTPHGSLRPRSGPSKTTRSQTRGPTSDCSSAVIRSWMARYTAAASSPSRRRPRSARGASCTVSAPARRRRDHGPADLHLGHHRRRGHALDDAGGDRGAHAGVSAVTVVDPDPGVDAPHAVDELHAAPADRRGVGATGAQSASGRSTVASTRSETSSSRSRSPSRTPAPTSRR